MVMNLPKMSIKKPALSRLVLGYAPQKQQLSFCLTKVCGCNEFVFRHTVCVVLTIRAFRGAFDGHAVLGDTRISIWSLRYLVWRKVKIMPIRFSCNVAQV